MTEVDALDLELVARLEAHALIAWPATASDRTADGWILRATPGLARGRSNHALPPPRELSGGEISAGLAQVEAFAASHQIASGVQVSPLELHASLDEDLRARGWRAQEPVLVMTATVETVTEDGVALALDRSDGPDEAWLEAWAICEPGRDVESHVSTVFELLRSDRRAWFGRYGREAVGIAVESDGLAGLFCLAVAPSVRRRGYGTALVRGLLRNCSPEVVAYLQVEARNRAALSMYERLGFSVTYTYRHCTAPPS